MRKTIFCDIDGTILKHQKTLHQMLKHSEILPGVIEQFTSWRTKDYYIVLTTARPRGCRLATELQLNSLGIFFDELIMGLPTGERIVINDQKPDGTITVNSICLKRDVGLQNIGEI